jgi:hypothetical protein
MRRNDADEGGGEQLDAVDNAVREVAGRARTHGDRYHAAIGSLRKRSASFETRLTALFRMR